MTIVNVHVAPDEVLVATDLEKQAVDGRTSRVGKVFAIPHMPALLTGRGSFVFVTGMFCVAVDFGDFDDLLNKMPELCVANIASLRALSSETLPPDFDRQQVVLAGYSARRARLVAFLLSQDAAGAGFRTEEIVDQLLAPWSDELGPPVVPSSTDAMRQAMQLQAPWLRAQGFAASEDMVFARLTRTSLTLTAPERTLDGFTRIDALRHFDQGI
jgi:hypothetical protein